MLFYEKAELRGGGGDRHAAPRVLLLTDADVFAGTERHMLELGRALRRCGVEVRIGCPAGAVLQMKAEAAGLAVVPVEKGGLIDFKAIAILTRLLREGTLDVIHAHNGRTALSAALAVRLTGRGRCVFTQHFLEPCRVTRRGPKAWLSALAYGWLNRNIHRFIAISEAVKAGILHRGDAKEKMVAVVPNGISPPDRAGLAPAGALRSRLGVADKAPLVVCAARLEKEKNVASLVEAMAAVTREIPGAVCVVAGEGTEQAALEARIAALGLQKNVRLLGFCDDVLSWMAAADLFVLPSLAEPFGLVLLEAMALGGPVIATRAGGPVEIVTDETGRLVPPADTAALAENIVSLLRNAVLREQMGAAGRRRFEEQFTADRMARQMLAVYEKAAGACASS